MLYESVSRNPLYGYNRVIFSLLIHSPVEGFGNFHFGKIIHKVAINIHIQCFVRRKVSFLWSKYIRAGIMSHIVRGGLSL